MTENEKDAVMKQVRFEQYLKSGGSLNRNFINNMNLNGKAGFIDMLEKKYKAS